MRALRARERDLTASLEAARAGRLRDAEAVQQARRARRAAAQAEAAELAELRAREARFPAERESGSESSC